MVGIDGNGRLVLLVSTEWVGTADGDLRVRRGQGRQRRGDQSPDHEHETQPECKRSVGKSHLYPPSRQNDHSTLP